MTTNLELLERFYTGLQNSDLSAIRASYAPDIVYSDPVFGELVGDRAVAMWDMFFSRDEPLQVEFGDLRADDTTGSGRWEARYVFTKSGRDVHNVINSKFRFANGLIAAQQDSFSVYRWASMALGPLGRVAGWSPPLKSALRKQSGQMIDRFLAR